jgi:hypothetical protein
MLAAVDTSENTRLYDATTLRQIGTTYAPPWTQAPAAGAEGLDFSAAEFAPDGRHLYTSDQEGRLWAIPTSVDLWEADVCRVANRSFTPAEWHLYVPGRGYQPACTKSP